MYNLDDLGRSQDVLLSRVNDIEKQLGKFNREHDKITGQHKTSFEPEITDGTIHQFWRGDKLWASFPYINVLEYDADPTGATDSTAAIQGAIDASPGGTVYIPAGTYKTTTPIFLKAGVHIEGASSISTIISIDHSGTSHAAAFQSPAGADLYEFSIRHLWIIFGACGTPSAQAADIGINLLATGGMYLYDVTDIRIGNAYWAYYDDSDGFHGKVDRVWSNMCRNGFYKKHGDTIIFENCEVGGRKDLTDGYAYYFENIMGLVMNSCVCESWKANDVFYFKDLRQSTFINPYLEDVLTLTTGTNDKRMVFFDNCRGTTLSGITFWACYVTPANNYQLNLLYFNNGNGTICGQIEGSGGSNKITPDNIDDYDVLSKVHTLGFNGTAHFALTGCDIYELETAGGYLGAKYALKNYSNTSHIVVIASTITSTSDDFAQITVV